MKCSPLFEGELSLTFLFLNVRQLKSEAFFLVYFLQHEAEDEGGYAQTGKHHQRSGVVELCGVCNAGIGLVEYFADKQWEEPQTDVLNQENQCIGRTNYFGIH